MTQQQKKFILAYHLLDGTLSEASRSWAVVNETNRTFPKLVAKKRANMSNKTQIIFKRKLGSYKNMLNFMAIVYNMNINCLRVYLLTS